MNNYVILSLVAEIDPIHNEKAGKLIEQLLQSEEANKAGKYHKISTSLPMLHFASMMIFEDRHHDPLLVIELNFDGRQGPFMAALENVYGDELRKLLRCCKPPRTCYRAMFDAVTETGSRAPLAPYLETLVVRPCTPYRGARGFDRRRIEEEATLYKKVQTVLGDGCRFAGSTADTVHAAVREELLADPETKLLLTDSAPSEAPWRPQSGEWLALIGLIAALYVLLGLPGLVAGWLLDPLYIALATGATMLAVVARWRDVRKLSSGGATRLTGLAASAAIFAGLVLVLAALHRLDILPVPPAGAAARAGDGVFWLAARDFALLLAAGLFSAILVLCALLAELRRREASDPVHDPAVPDELTLKAIKAMVEREDKIGQNHMGSLLIVKPGVLRAILLRVSHLLLSRLARTFFSDGYLGSMRTIHFAHWSILDNGGRLLFISSFDGSWDSYLSDFIEKASKGVNLAWANCIGFPPSTFILKGGSQNGRQFKAWARHSMAPTLFWFSAYPDLPVDAIHRNARVAAGLRRAALSDAQAWARDL
jgi:hypothetical protein